MKVQPILWRITSPSLRTKRLVETPTLAVCGATGLPTSAPTELSVGRSSSGKPKSLPTEAWNAPNIALVEVLLPDSATPIQPSAGATMMNQGPIVEKPLASELAMPEKLKTKARPKMKTPTRKAPHIWCQVLRATSRNCAPLMPTRKAMMIHDTMIAVPPTPGAQRKAAPTVLPASIDEPAETPSLNGTYFGKGDHGPVHSTTTTTSTMKGSHARKISPPLSAALPAPSFACSAADTVLPP